MVTASFLVVPTVQDSPSSAPLRLRSALFAGATLLREIGSELGIAPREITA